MSIRASLYLLMAASLIVVSAWVKADAQEPRFTQTAEASEATETNDAKATPDEATAEPADADEAAADQAAPEQATQEVAGEASEPIGLFDAIDDGLVDVTFIARDDHRGRVIVENKTDKEVHFQMPEAFVGVPVLAQVGGGGFGGGGGGQTQSVGGGGGGGGLGGGGGGGGLGGGGGAFSVAPEKAAKINVPLLCLEHGKRIPSSKKPYKIVPAEDELSSRPEVIELLAAFGRGELQRGAAQAAVWHANSDVSWQELAAKLTGTVRNVVRNPYFTAYEMQAAVAYHQEAVRRAAVRAMEQGETPVSDEESMSDRRSYDDADQTTEG